MPISLYTYICEMHFHLIWVDIYIVRSILSSRWKQLVAGTCVGRMPTANGMSSSCLRGWLEDFSQHWGGLAEWCAKKMQDIKKKRIVKAARAMNHRSDWQRHITYYIQQNSLRWSSQFGMQEHLICALHTIQKFQVKMAHILLQGQKTL